MTDTSKVSERRKLHFHSMCEILEDVESLGRSEIRATGNWTPAQIVGHVNTLIVMSIDGFTFRAPRVLRAAGRVLRSYFLKNGLKPGISRPPGTDDLVPSAELSWDEAVEHLRETIARLENGARMTQPSPIFGKLSHEQWEQLHCRHAELHFGFMHPVRADSNGPSDG